MKDLIGLRQPQEDTVTPLAAFSPQQYWGSKYCQCSPATGRKIIEAAQRQWSD